MFSRVVFLLFLTGCLGVHERFKRSVNGTKSVHTTRLPNNTIVELPYGIEYPYMVQVQHKEKHLCGGALVKPDFAITARHCFRGDVGEANNTDYYLIAGNQIRNDRNSWFVQFRQVDKVVQHPTAVLYYDIAIMKVKKPFDLNIHVNVVKLPPQGDKKKYFNQKVVQLGWGVTENKTYSEYLLKVYGTIEDCKENEALICIRGLDGGYPKSGDSGGPAVIQGNTREDDLVIGVLFAGGLGPTSYEASLLFFSNWINNTIATM